MAYSIQYHYISTCSRVHLIEFNFECKFIVLSNREGFEKSCYRLKTITGDFIYLKTHGYLEPCEDVQHSTFVCVNTLVSSEEGEQEIQYMKKRFSVYIESKVESVILTPPEKRISSVST